MYLVTSSVPNGSKEGSEHSLTKSVVQGADRLNEKMAHVHRDCDNV